MNCSQCGAPLPEGSRFCQTCGAPVNQQPAANAQTPQGAVPPQQPAYQQPQQPPYPPYTQQPYGTPPYPGPPKKKKTGLIIGLIAGAVILIGAAVALYLFVFSGTPVTGQWYCEERGQVLVFEDDGSATGYSLTGTVDAKYEYDKGKGEGTVSANGTELSFKVDKDGLSLTNDDADDESIFVKTDSQSDPEELVLSALQGLWSSEEIGEVLEFKSGKINVYSGYGDFDGTYDYDIDKGQGTFTANGAEFEFYADYDGLSVTNTGEYVKADKSLDIKAFVTEHAMPLLGMWYDASGTYGSIEFNNDGTAQLVMFDQPLTATYTYDVASGTGTFSTEATGETSTMTYQDGTIVIDGITYTQNYVEQMGADDLQTITGTWYEATGTLGTLEFYDDGSVAMDLGGAFYTGVYSYDPITSSGVMNIDVNGTGSTIYFGVQDGRLDTDQASYTRDYVEPEMGLTGIWYSLAGTSNTLSFGDDGSAYFMDADNNVLSGTYTFNVAAGYGTLTLDVDGTPMDYDMTMSKGILTVNGEQFAFDNVDDGL